MDECTCTEWKRNYSDKPNWEYCPYCSGIIHKPEPKQPTHIDLASQNLSLASGLSKKQATVLIEAVIFAYGKESAIGPPEE